MYLCAVILYIIHSQIYKFMKTAQHLLFLLSLWLLAGGVSRAASYSVSMADIDGLLDNERYSVMAEYPFVIVSDYNEDEAPVMTDSLFNALAVGVRFQVNRTEINTNSDFFRTYHELLPFLQREGYQLRQLFLRGAASPEGSYENNRRLGQGRTAALQSLIQQDLSGGPFAQQQIKMDVQSVTEDYAYLITLMEQRHDADYARVKQVFDDCHGDEQTCKQLLSRLDGGRLWSRLKQEYFPELRTARIVLWLSRPKPVFENVSVSDVVVEQPTQPDTIVIEAPQITVQVPAEPPMERRHLLALRTNLVHDFFYMPQFGMAFSPNLQVEYYPLDGHYTYNLGFTWSNHRHWTSQKFFQVRDLQLELRRYFQGEGRFLGLYLGAFVHGDVYGIGLSKTKGWEGEGGGAGLSLGYVMPLNKRGNWRLEFMAAAGFFLTRYDPYVYGNPASHEEDGDYYYDYLGSASAFKKRNHQFQWFGPTNLGIQITYDILYRKNKTVKKGDAR